PRAAHQAVLRLGRRSQRQRRVGETSWIETRMRMTDRSAQARRLRGQNVSRRTPNGCGSGAATPPPTPLTATTEPSDWMIVPSGITFAGSGTGSDPPPELSVTPGPVPGKMPPPPLVAVVEIAPFVTVASRLHQPPYPSEAPQITSYWAANGLNQSKASGARPLIGPTPVVPLRNPVLVFTPAIVFQNSTPNIVPRDRNRTVKNVTTVAPWVRCIAAEMNSPSEPRPIAETIRTAY